MKVRIIISVLLAMLLIGMVGSKAYAYNYNSNVVDKGRYYCPIHTVIYRQAGSHQNCTRQTLVVGSKYKYCSKCNTKYPVHLTHSCPLPIEIIRKTYPVVQGKKYSQPVVTKTESKSIFNFLPIDVDILVTQDRYRYRGYGSYGRYGYVRNYYGGYGYDRTYYDLSGRNYFHKWFGSDRYGRGHGHSGYVDYVEYR